MRCPACEHQNAADAKFCAECGTELTITCPTCGVSSPLGVKFCNNCGTDLRAGAAQQDDPLARFVPPEMLAKLRSAQAGQAMRGERRTVTMLFADITGSTAAAGQLDPEEWADVMNGAFESLIRPIYRYEGTLARLLGDAILAFFGAPIAHEDDPIRALRAGLEILDGMAEYATEVQARHGIPIEVRVGVNTGLVVVGEVGSDLRVEYTALGDAINVAARMEQTAAPGTMQVTEHTLSLTHGSFEAEDLGLVELKGKAEPIRTFRPVRFVGRATPAPTGSLIGRAAEVEQLDELRARLLDGRGWIASIVADAGLGKTALLREWERTTDEAATVAHAASADGELAWMFGACQSYDSATPFAGIREVLRPWLGLDGSDDFGRIAEATSTVEMDDAAALVAYLAGVEMPDDAARFIHALDPPVLRARSSAALRAYLASEAERRPLALVFEDLHWADDLSIDIVTDLLGLAETTAVGLLIVMRPYRDDPSWRVHERADRDHHHRYHHLRLEPMTTDDSAALLDSLLDSSAVDAGSRDSILERSAGNPLFLEEIAHSVSTAGIEAGVPDSLSGILTARLDRLDDEAHLVAQVAAVLGTEFRRPALRRLIEGEDLDTKLAALMRAGVLVESPTLREGLRFRHALMQEAAYQSILLKTRRRLHRDVAEHLQSANPDDVEGIARHLVAAEDYVAALPHLVEAGARATKAMALADAIRQYRLALDHAPDDADPALVQRAHLGLGEAYALLPDLSESAAAFQRLFEYGQQHQRPSAQVAALNQLAFTSAAFGGDPEAAADYLAQARQLAEESGDERGLADYHMNACMVASFLGDPETAVSHDFATIELGDRLGDDRIRIEGLVRRAMNQTVLLDLANAESSIELAMAAAREAGLDKAVAELDTLGNGFLALSRGKPLEAAETIERNLPALERFASFDTAMSHRLLGFVRCQLGDLESALSSMAAARRSAQQSQQPFVDGVAAAGMAAVYATLGRTDEIPALKEAALGMSEGPLADLYASSAWADVATAELIAGDLMAAEESFSRGLAASSLTQFFDRTRLLGGLALSLVTQGDTDRPATLLAEAREFVDSTGFVGSNAFLDYVEGCLQQALGRAADAAVALQRAVESARAEGRKLLMAAAARTLTEVADDPSRHQTDSEQAIAGVADDIIDEDLRRAFLAQWSGPVVLATA